MKVQPCALIVPGWQNSGPEHWQSAWQAFLPRASRVEQLDWDHPERSAWVEALDRAVHEADARVLLIAHSLGCLTVAFWAGQAKAASLAKIVGALLVAPPDVERVDADPQLHSFRPVSRLPLPFPSTVVASTDDPYCAPARAQQMAQDWHARWVSIGAAGHINTDAGYTEWHDGLQLLRALYASAETSAA